MKTFGDDVMFQALVVPAGSKDKLRTVLETGVDGGPVPPVGTAAVGAVDWLLLLPLEPVP